MTSISNKPKNDCGLVGNRSEKGFTLLEIMIAISILSIGLLAIANMQIQSVDSNSSAKNTTEAVCLAQDKLEELLSLDYDDEKLDNGSPSPPTTSDGYTLSYEIDKDNPVTNAKFIKVRVTWQDVRTTRSSELSTLKYDM